MLTIGSLFSGVGGLELGLERAGLGPVKWQVEIDPYCRDVLAKHWPGARRYEDVRTVGGGAGYVDLLCGGFPCQDLSRAGAQSERLGLDGARSGLWSEYARIIGELRPRFVVVENVADLAWNGLDRVLADLAGYGYDAVWFPVAAADVGAPHLRHRLFVVAYIDEVGRAAGGQTIHPTPVCQRKRWDQPPMREREVCVNPVVNKSMAHGWDTEPEMVRVVHGVPRDVVRTESQAIGALGNAVVPQVAEVVGWVVRGIHERLTQCC